jgi:HEAT repeat protein
VQALGAALEAQRLQAVESLAAHGSPLARDSLQELATLQAALTAVREVIETHSFRLGWGENPEAP